MKVKEIFIAALCIFSLFSYGFSGEKNSTPHFAVGEFGSLWTFGSDHLPIGVSINERHFVSWNILNKDYLKWIETNSQGLKDSTILKENTTIHPNTNLTVREDLIVDEIVRMAQHRTHPRSLIALQETHQDVLGALNERLPASFVSFTTFPGDIAHGDVFYYDSTVFDFVDYIGNTFDNSHNTWMILTLKDKDSGVFYSFVQSHVPGGESSPIFLKQLAEKCLDYLDGNAITLVMGDQNRSPDYFLEHLKAVAFERKKSPPFKVLPIPYPTHVNTLMEASWIDNLLIADPVGLAQEVRVSESGDEFFEELSSVISLLWSRFPFEDKVLKTRTFLPEIQKILALYEKSVSKWKLYALENDQFDLEKVLEAVQYAAQKHEGQYRKDAEKTPYIVHPLQVAENLWDIGKIRNHNILIAALLHDTLEDTDATADEIEALFGSRVLATVQEVTNDPNLSAEQNKQRQIDKASKMSQDARLVKLSDRLANIRDLKDNPPTWSQDKIREYYLWGKKLLKVLQGTNESLEEALKIELKGL